MVQTTVSQRPSQIYVRGEGISGVIADCVRPRLCPVDVIR